MHFLRRFFLLAAGIVLNVGIVNVRSSQAQQPQSGADDQVQIQTISVADGIYMLYVGRGSNIAVFAGEDGVILVNASSAQLSRRIVETVEKISSKPIRFIINTDSHEPNTAGNAIFGKLGVAIVSHENVRKRLSVERFNPRGTQRIPALPTEALPTLTYTHDMSLHFSGEDIHVFHEDSAHSDSDSVVYFHRANVVQTGDLFFPNNYPIIDVSGGGTISGMIAAVDRILKMANPQTKVIPGRGPLSNLTELTEFRDMLVTVRDRVLEGIRAGKTLEQILDTKPTTEFDENRKGWHELANQRTGTDFAKEVYEDLSRLTRR